MNNLEVMVRVGILTGHALALDPEALDAALGDPVLRPEYREVVEAAIKLRKDLTKALGPLGILPILPGGRS
jgi:hypothetical protein